MVREQFQRKEANEFQAGGLWSSYLLLEEVYLSIRVSDLPAPPLGPFFPLLQPLK